MSDPGTTTRDVRAGLARSSAAVATGTLLSRLTGLLRVGALAWAVGGGSLADAYNLANTTPNIVYELLLGGILAATIVPIFVRHAEAHDERSTSAVFTVTLTVLTGFTLVAMACTPLIARLFSINTSGPERAAQLHVITVLTLCFLPQMVFYGLTALETAVLNAHRRFVAAAYAPVLNNVVVIGVLAVFASRTAHGRTWTDATRLRSEGGLLLLLGLGTTAGIIAMALVLVPAVRRARIHLRPVFAWRDAGVRTMVRLSGWTLGYVATNQIAQLFVLVLAKTGDSGDVTAYVYAFTFYVLPYGLLAVSLMTTMTPELARRAASGDRHGLRRDFNMGLRYLIVLVLPASVLFAVLAQPIVGVLTVGGRFSEHSAHVTGDALQLFALSLVPFSVYLYAMRGFYALHDTRTPFVLNSAENAVNVGLALALFPWLGVQGLALAWSVAYGVSAFSALARLRRRIGQVPDTGVRAATARAVLGAIALAIVGIPLAGAIGSRSAGRAVVATGVAATAGALAYLAVLSLLRSDELGAIVGIVRRRTKASADVSP